MDVAALELRVKRTDVEKASKANEDLARSSRVAEASATSLARSHRDLGSSLAATDRGFQSTIRNALALGKSTADASRGAGMARSAIQQLASQAAGLNGPLGNLVGSLGAFGVGGAVTTAFLGGFVAMRKGMEWFERDMTERSERIGNLNFDALSQRRTPLETATKLVSDARTNLKDARNGLPGAGRVDDAQATLTFFLGKQREIIQDLANAEREFAASIAGMLGRQPAFDWRLAPKPGAFPRASSGINVAASGGIDRLPLLRSAWGGHSFVEGSNFTSPVPGLRGLRNEAAWKGADGSVGGLGTVASNINRALERALTPGERFRKLTTESGRAFDSLSRLSSGIDLLGAVTDRQTRTGGFLQAAGGLLMSSKNPTAAGVGLGLGILGGFVNLFGGGKKQKVEVTNWPDELKQRRPIYVTEYRYGTGGPERAALYEKATADDTRRDAIERRQYGSAPWER